MKRIHRDIIKRAGCAVLDYSYDTIPDIKSDLTRRLKRQEKALVKTVDKGWQGKEIIEKSIEDIRRTLAVL